MRHALRLAWWSGLVLLVCLAVGAGAWAWVLADVRWMLAVSLTVGALEAAVLLGAALLGPDRWF